MELIRDELLSDAAVDLLQTQVRELQRAAARDRGRASVKPRHVEDIDREIANLVQALANLGYSEAVADHLRALEAEKKLIAAPKRVLESVALDSVSGAVATYRKMIGELEHSIGKDDQRVRSLLREMLGPVTLYREGKALWAALESKTERSLIASALPLDVVAGTGFEPVTFGL